MKLRRMLALTLVLMTLMTAALAADDPGLYYIGDDATPENLTGHTRIYNAVDAAPGWRYGFVAYLTDGTRVYSDSSAAQEGAVSFDIPEETQYLYFVVLGAPESYQVHVWDNDEATDAQMPFDTISRFNCAICLRLFPSGVRSFHLA